MRIRALRWTKPRPPSWSLIPSPGLVRGPQGGAEQVARRDRLAGTRQGRTLGEGLLQVVEGDPHDAAQPIDAAVHRLVHTARVLEERARAQAGAEHREREVEPHGDPAPVAREGIGEGRDGLLVLPEAQLAPADQLPEVLLPLAPKPSLRDDLLAQAVGLGD